MRFACVYGCVVICVGVCGYVLCMCVWVCVVHVCTLLKQCYTAEYIKLYFSRILVLYT